MYFYRGGRDLSQGRATVIFRHAALLVAAFAVCVLPAIGQEKADDAKPAAAKEAPPEPLKATVVSVSGIAEKRLGSDPKSKWEPIKVGDVLDPLTLVRTGLGAKVALKFGERSTMTVKSGTKIGIAEFHKKGRLVRTHLGLKYGSIRTRVDTTRGPNDFKVATPVATLSIRGSGGNTAFSGDRGFGHGTNTGSYNVTSDNGRTNSVNQGQTNDGNRNPSDLITVNTRAPGVGGLWGQNPNEQRNINQYGGGSRLPFFYDGWRRPPCPRPRSGPSTQPSCP